MNGLSVGIAYGMHVYLSPDVPKMQLSAECPVTPDFRVEMNRWMLEFFGTTNKLADGEIIGSAQFRFVTMNPRTWANVQAALKSTNVSVGARL